MQSISIEIATLIALELDGGDLCALLLVNKQLWSLYWDRLFWEKKLEISETEETPVQTLRQRYIRRYLATESLEQHRIPTSRKQRLARNPRELFLTSKTETGPVLYFRDNDDMVGVSRSTICDLQANHIFLDQPLFLPYSLFDHGKLCLGREDVMVVRRVQDWSLVARLTRQTPTFPNVKIWTRIGFESDLLLIVHGWRGHIVEKLELWDSTGTTCKGTIQYPGMGTWASLPGSKQILTADNLGNARIWDVLHLTYTNFPTNLGNGLRFVNPRGNILLALDEIHRGDAYYHLHNEPLPPRLQGRVRNPDFWESFSDGTYVLGDVLRDTTLYEGPNSRLTYPPCQFTTFTTDGKEQASFQADGVKRTITFMDRYIVTIAYKKDLIVWNKLGEQLVRIYLGYYNPSAVEVGVGTLFVIDTQGDSVKRGQWLEFWRPAKTDNKGEIVDDAIPSNSEHLDLDVLR